MLSELLQRRRVAATDCYRRATSARERGEWAEAIGWYRRTLAEQPGHAEALNDLGIALCAVRDFDAARQAYAQALALRGDWAPAHINLGQLLQSEFRDYHQAAAHYRAALALDPAQHQARINLAVALYEHGLADDAVACLREALERSPEDALAHQFMLFMSNALPQRNLHAWFAEHCLWGQRYADGLPRIEHPAGQPKRRLRIGYVSADLREHATANCVGAILARHDLDAFDIFCYNNSAEADAVTEQMRKHAHGWREIDAIDDAQAAQLIHADGIDLLVDLSGHTRGNRLGVFARKPAPVQISYLGYLNTTGMAAIDFRITDALADPPGSEQYHREILLRMPQTLWCFQPPHDAPPVSSLPAQDKGYITFGSFNHIAKLNSPVLGLWAELMRRLPESRLQVLALPDERAAGRLRSAMQAQGVDPARIVTLPRFAREQYWRAFADVDIALDPFPYTGGATTCETLWMGVPVVTLAGSFGFARSATTVLLNAGLRQCVADGELRYLDAACVLAADLPALAQLRATLRERLCASPLLDAAGFTRDLETLYRDAWRKWCGQVAPRGKSC